MRQLFSLISLSILAMVLAWPTDASAKSTAQSLQNVGEPAQVQHERVRMQTRAVHEHLKFRRQQAEAARARDEDARPTSVEGGGKAAVGR